MQRRILTKNFISQEKFGRFKEEEAERERRRKGSSDSQANGRTELLVSLIDLISTKMGLSFFIVCQRQQVNAGYVGRVSSQRRCIHT